MILAWLRAELSLLR